MKKIISILLAAVIIFSLSVFVYAAEINSETVELILNTAKEIIEMLVYIFKETLMPLITSFVEAL